MQIVDLSCEYRVNPLGIDMTRPRLAWRLSSNRRCARQQAYQIRCYVSGTSSKGDGLKENVLWDSGRVNSDQSTHIPYDGPVLQSRQKIYWHVRIWDEKDEPTGWSAPAWFEMGLLSKNDWQAQWISNTIIGGPRTSVPCPYFRHEFNLEQAFIYARLYITAQGLYEATINGNRVGKDYLTPGWTDYDKRVQYQTYDVTDLLNHGKNVIGVILGDGWYCGHIGWENRQNYGNRPKLFAQLEITLDDGTIQTIATDRSWLTALSPILESDLLMGEAYDARLEIPGWNLTSGDLQDFERNRQWSPVLTFPNPPNLAIVAQNTTTVRVHTELNPIGQPCIIEKWPDNQWIFDFGQNLVGRVRLKVNGERGTTIIMQFGEMLDASGQLYTENLRSARQTDAYTLKGDPDGEVYESRFTFHGFRYVQVTGLSGPPNRDMLTAVVLSSENIKALEFECSDPLINQLHHNIEWGWKGNSIDVPTDCPQRDERLGWTGDAQVFAKTATYITRAASFFSKWIQDLADAQLDYGAIPPFAPFKSKSKKYDGGPAWSDAFIIIPWTIWQQYGDIRILETHYDAMCRYMNYLVTNSPDKIRLLPDLKEINEETWQIGGYGDWLAQDGASTRGGLTPKDLIGTAFLAYDAKLMTQIADAIGKPEDAKIFNQLYEDTRKAFAQRFITPDGLLIGQTQTSYILALYFNLVPNHVRPIIVQGLVNDIESRNKHLSTGFVGTPYICQILTESDFVNLAYDLLFQKSFPSWLYSVLQGATTIWERWDGWTEENGFQDPGMNSFNHYAYGAIGGWMYENITGIRTDPERPGYKHIILQPRITDRLSFARAEYLSNYGGIKSHWKFKGESLIWDITIPPNTTATVYMPTGDQTRIYDGDIPIDEILGIECLDIKDVTCVYKLQSGTYHFLIKI